MLEHAVTRWRKRQRPACVNSARFEEVSLERADTEVPALVDGLVPFHAGNKLNWRFCAA